MLGHAATFNPADVFQFIPHGNFWHFFFHFVIRKV